MNSEIFFPKNYLTYKNFKGVTFELHRIFGPAKNKYVIQNKINQQMKKPFLL